MPIKDNAHTMKAVTAAAARETHQHRQQQSISLIHKTEPILRIQLKLTKKAEKREK